ncbi:MAG: hypothetical protein R6X17_09265 [Candidatus Competibacteraceae bacterium]
MSGSRDPATVREVLIALAAWLADEEQAELRRSFLLWLREAFFRARLPWVELPELNDLEEARIMLGAAAMCTIGWCKKSPCIARPIPGGRCTGCRCCWTRGRTSRIRPG